MGRNGFCQHCGAPVINTLTGPKHSPAGWNERRNAFKEYMEEEQYKKGSKKDGLKSYKRIASDLMLLTHSRVDPSTLFHWMREDFPQIAAEMARRNPCNVTR